MAVDGQTGRKTAGDGECVVVVGEGMPAGFTVVGDAVGVVAGVAVGDDPSARGQLGVQCEVPVVDVIRGSTETV